MQSVIQLPIFLFWRFLSLHMVTCFDCIISEHYIINLIFFSQLNILCTLSVPQPYNMQKMELLYQDKRDLLCGITLN
jgi:hypothetical protein